MDRKSLGKNIGGAALVGCLAVVACVEQPSPPIPPDVGGDRQPTTPEIPPFPDLCSRYQIQYAGDGCSGGCPEIECPCLASTASTCYPERGCVASLDCAAFCKVTGPSPRAPLYWDCLGDCQDSNDCAGQPCVVLPGATRGVCNFFGGGYCLDDAQCSPGDHCVAVSADGVRVCSGGGAPSSEEDACNRATDCAGGRQCALPDASFLGRCTTGSNSDLCFHDSDCKPGRVCVATGESYAPGIEFGRCGDGGDLAPCARDSDCRPGRCFDHRCSTGGLYDACAGDGDCQSGLRCVAATCRDGAG